LLGVRLFGYGVGDSDKGSLVLGVTCRCTCGEELVEV
jgi:hypothetical protein